MMIQFLDVGLFPKEEFGLRDVNFSLAERERVELVLGHREERKALHGLLSGRYRPQLGRIRKEPEKILTQSDVELLGEQVIKEEISQYWRLHKPTFSIGGEKRHKLTFIEKLKAKSLRHFPPYKLRGEEKEKFCLLSLLFQSKGLILVSQLHQLALTEEMKEVFHLIHQQSSCTICYLRLGDEPNNIMEELALLHPIRTIFVGSGEKLSGQNKG